MKKTYLLCLFALLLLNLSSAQQKAFSTIIQHFNQAEQANKPLVVAHRGDWRHAPENSLQGLENVIAMGVDVYELDLKQTKDSVLLLMHDETLDRSSTGKGKPQDFTLAELSSVRLKNGLGRATTHQIPTFEAFLLQAKGRIMIDVDKGYPYFKQVVSLVQKHQMENQVIINIDKGLTLADVLQQQGAIPSNIILMPIIDLDKPNYEAYFQSYLARKNTVFQPIFKTVDKQALAGLMQLKKQGYNIWLNALWPSLNAGHDDDTAVEENKKTATWGWLMEQGATLIQTDRPAAFLHYINN